jgi:hypothetical protein
LEQVLFVVGGTCRSPKISKSTSWQTLKIPICLAVRAVKGRGARRVKVRRARVFLAGEFMRGLSGNLVA